MIPLQIVEDLSQGSLPDSGAPQLSLYIERKAGASEMLRWRRRLRRGLRPAVPKVIERQPLLLILLTCRS